MAERMSSRYRRLFDVRLLHHFWLDEGSVVFDQIADQAKREARLLTYDVRSFLTSRPTAATESSLRGFGCLFRETTVGFVVAAQESAIIPPSTTFEFVITVKDRRFFDYTSLTMRPQKIHELFNPADGVIYRYKENVPVASNLTGTARGAGSDRVLFLSRDIPAADPNDQVESLILSGSALLQLTSDNPSASTQQLAAQATDLPLYVHQADVPAITPPVGLTGAPARGVRLSADIPDDTFLVISLRAERADDNTYSFVDGTGAPKTAAPIYEVRFRNRSTVRTYLDKRIGTVMSTEANPLPLTHFGNAGTKQKPSAGLVKAEKSGSKITRLISEIYV
jgi:hypothetical protein